MNAAPKRESTYVGQYRQDAIVDQLLGRMTAGVFVDVGAYDGVTLSNTYFLEKARGWTGVCFEPNPAVFEQLKAKRSCVCENVGVGPQPGQLPYLKVSGYAEMGSGLVDRYDPRHLQRIEREIVQHGGSKEELSIPVVSLNDYLLNHGLTQIDFCSLDVEGGELAILRSLDFSQLMIRIIAVENNYWEQDTRQFLRSQGYALIRVAVTDDLFGRVGSVPRNTLREALLRITGALSVPGRILERRLIG